MDEEDLKVLFIHHSVLAYLCKAREKGSTVNDENSSRFFSATKNKRFTGKN